MVLERREISEMNPSIALTLCLEALSPLWYREGALKQSTATCWTKKAEIRVQGYCGGWNLWGKAPERRALCPERTLDIRLGVPMNLWLHIKLYLHGARIRKAGQRTTTRERATTGVLWTKRLLKSSQDWETFKFWPARWKDLTEPPSSQEKVSLSSEESLL